MSQIENFWYKLPAGVKSLIAVTHVILIAFLFTYIVMKNYQE